MTEMSHPVEIILRFDTDSNTIYEPRPKISRTKTGCFNCRKRKKKCDETKPSCTSCTSKCVPCVWPKGGERLPKDYTMPKADTNKLVAKKQKRKKSPNSTSNEIKAFVPVKYESHTESLVECAPTLTSASPLPSPGPKNTFKPVHIEGTHSNSSITTDQPPCDEEFPFDCEPVIEVPSKSITLCPFECLDTEMVLSEDFSSSSSQPFLSISNLFTNLSHANKDSIYIVACVNGFIKSLNTQYTHPSLTTSATFTPLIKTNKLIEELALTCGVAYLSWQDYSLKEKSLKMYYQASSNLSEYLESGDFDLQRDQSWLGAAFQMMCLCSKTTLGTKIESSLASLNNSYKLIRMKTKMRRIITKQELENASDVYDSMKELSHNDWEMKDSLVSSSSRIEDHEEIATSFFTTAFEKMFLDSFIFNYSVGVLLTPSIRKLPNPFQVFKDLRGLLKTQLFNCEVSWMNNPVMGASLDSFELAAKASYLIRTLDDPATPVAAKTLYEIANYLTQSTIPIELKSNPKTYGRLKDSVLVSECVASATKILLLKTIDINIKETDPKIQREVSVIISKIGQVEKEAECKGISPWALFICGLACVDAEERTQIIREIEIVGEITRAHYIFRLFECLEIAWGTSPNKDKFKDLQGAGLDVLLDVEFLSTVVM